MIILGTVANNTFQNVRNTISLLPWSLFNDALKLLPWDEKRLFLCLESGHLSGGSNDTLWPQRWGHRGHTCSTPLARCSKWCGQPLQPLRPDTQESGLDSFLPHPYLCFHQPSIESCHLCLQNAIPFLHRLHYLHWNHLHPNHSSSLSLLASFLLLLILNHCWHVGENNLHRYKANQFHPV